MTLAAFPKVLLLSSGYTWGRARMRPPETVTSPLGNQGQKSDECHRKDRNEGEGAFGRKWESNLPVPPEAQCH